MAGNDWQKKFSKFSMVLNVVIMTIFFALNDFTNYRNSDRGLTAIYYIIFVTCILSANYVLYKYFKK